MRVSRSVGRTARRRLRSTRPRLNPSFCSLSCLCSGRRRDLFPGREHFPPFHRQRHEYPSFGRRGQVRLRASPWPFAFPQTRVYRMGALRDECPTAQAHSRRPASGVGLRRSSAGEEPSLPLGKGIASLSQRGSLLINVGTSWRVTGDQKKERRAEGELAARQRGVEAERRMPPSATTIDLRLDTLEGGLHSHLDADALGQTAPLAARCADARRVATGTRSDRAWPADPRNRPSADR
jgi:hypothetical protein